MIFGQLPGRSPQKDIRSFSKTLNSIPLYHMTCRQLNQLKIHYDDIHYQSFPVSKIICIGRIHSSQKISSPRGLPMIDIKFQDSTDRTIITFYASQETETLCLNRQSYFKFVINAKVAGLVYRPSIKLMGVSIKQIVDFNQITLHSLECIQTFLKTE